MQENCQTHIIEYWTDDLCILNNSKYIYTQQEHHLYIK